MQSKQISLSRLILTNFKGMNFDLNIDSMDVDVLGRNALGKTTLADAWQWLISGKDSAGRTDGRAGFQVKTLRPDGKVEHRLEHSVEALINADGAMIILKRLLREVWSRKRGSPTETLTGNKTEYFRDGVSLTETEYKALISQLFGDEKILRLVTNPMAFPSLPWQDQRALVVNVCGDISDADVIQSDKALYDLPGILKGKTLDDHKKIVTARQNELKKQLGNGDVKGELQVRIEEQTRSLPDVTGLDKRTVEDTVMSLERSIAEAQLRLQGIDNGSAITDLSKELAGVNADIAKLEADHYETVMKTVRSLSQQVSALEDKEASAKRRADSVKGEIAYKNKEIATLELQIKTKRDEWATVNAEVFQDGTPDQCAACGQFLPSDRVQQARDRALAAFNVKKSTTLEGIIDKGKELADRVKTLKEDVDRLTKETTEGLTEEDRAALEELKQQRDTAKTTATDYTQIADRAPLTEKKVDLENKIKEARWSVLTDKAAAKDEMTNLEDLLKGAKTLQQKFTDLEKGQERIDELKDQEKTLSIEYETLEKELYLCKAFTKAKVKLLTDHINARFKVVSFKLFNQLASGDLEETCEITVNGVPYQGNLNSAARINAGLDVCRTLSEHYGITAPIFVDNAETVCELMPMEAQVVRLIVSEGRWLPASCGFPPGSEELKTKIEGGETFYFWPDDKLRVEKAEKRRMVA